MAPYDTQLKREPTYIKRIGRPDSPGQGKQERSFDLYTQDKWQWLGYPDLESYEIVQDRLLANRRRLWRRRRGKVWLFKCGLNS